MATASDPPEALVLDLDGVVRHFAETEADLCREHGLAPGSILAAAVTPDLLHAAVTGAMTKRQWLTRVGERIEAPAAALAWGDTPAEVDDDVLELVHRVRRAGRTVCLFTNGTDEVPAELEDLGIVPHFDHVFNTAELGVPKPDPAAYALVCEHLRLAPAQVAFTDDCWENFAAARSVGMLAHHFTGAAGMGSWLGRIRALGG